MSSSSGPATANGCSGTTAGGQRAASGAVGGAVATEDSNAATVTTDKSDPTESSTVGGPDEAGSPRSDDDECSGQSDKIREVVERATSEDSKKKIDQILFEVQQLSDLEKLLLYLRLPNGTKSEVDPLKQSFISSLGNRSEVTQTVTWIQTHLKEDHAVSLPKQEVYDGYCDYCSRTEMKPLSTADFGKVMKQVFPTVRPRRLGTRGNSRYCYAGLKKKLLMDTPQLPDLSLTGDEAAEESEAMDPKVSGASSHLVREWAEKLLGPKFSDIRELACHLVDNSYVNNRSVAAFTLLSCLNGTKQGKESQPCSLLAQCTTTSASSGGSSKHRETQLQLQRKLHEKELIREQRKKLLETKGTVPEQPPQRGRSSSGGRRSSAGVSKLVDAATTGITFPVQVKVERTGDERHRSASAPQRDGPPGTAVRRQSGSGPTTVPTSATTQPNKKMAIPRVAPGSGATSAASKLCFSPATTTTSGMVSVMVFPVGSGVMPDYGGSPTTAAAATAAAAKPKSKYKPIQPKPSSRPNLDDMVTKTIAEVDAPPDRPHSSHTATEPMFKTLSSPPTEVPDAGRRCRMKVVPRRQKRPSDSSMSTCRESVASKRSRGGRDTPPSAVATPVLLPVKPEVIVPRLLEKEEPLPDGLQGEMNITTIENEALIEYLNGPPTADQEEELLQYFVSEDYESDRRTQGALITSASGNETNSANLSQLRRLLEKNLQGKATSDDRFVVQQPATASTTITSAKDMPTLRLLLGSKRLPSSETDSFSGRPSASSGGSLSPSTGLVTTTTNNSATTANGQAPNLFASHLYGRANTISEPATTAETSPTDANSTAGYLTEFSGDEVWSEFAATKQPDDVTLSSGDSSSGCLLVPPATFDPRLANLLSGGGSQLVTIDEHQLRNAQMSIDLESVNMLQSYPSPGQPSGTLNQSSGQQSVPPSPNTRRRAFNFMPISPRNTPVPETRSSTQSPLAFTMATSGGGGGGVSAAQRTSSSCAPNTAVSQPTSNSNSPFVSPRSTPSSLCCRSRHNSGQAAATSGFCTPRATPAHPLYVTEQQPQQLGITSSPFVSPHPTPVPFARSRHNSSQSVTGTRRDLYPGSALLATRSRHLSEYGTVLMSPGSAPMSPMDQSCHPGVQVDVAADTHQASTQQQLYLLSDSAQHIRSRHNSSTTAPASPHSAPMSPLVNSNSFGGGVHDTCLSDQLYGSPGIPLLPLLPPPPSNNDEAPRSGKSKMGVTTRRNGGRGAAAAADSSHWSSGLASRLPHLDPRLAARQRHASLGSVLCSGVGGQVAAPSVQILQSESQHLFIQQQQQQQQQQQHHYSEQESRAAGAAPPEQLQSAAHRSQSVPLYQMLQNSILQLEQSDPPTYNDVMISRSYPPTPVAQHAFTFDGDHKMAPQSMLGGGATYSSSLCGSGGGGGTGDDSQHAFLCTDDMVGGSGDPVRSTLHLPSDQFQLGEFPYDDDLTNFAEELAQYAP